PGPRPGDGRRRHGGHQARGAARGAGPRRGDPRGVRRLPAARRELRDGHHGAAGRRPRGPAHRARAGPAPDRQLRDRGRPGHRPARDRRLREPRRPHLPGRRRAAARPRDKGLRQQRQRRLRGRPARQHHRHLPARPAAAEERVAGGPPDRAGDGQRARAARRRLAGGCRAPQRPPRGRRRVTVEEYERRFRHAGLPMLVEDWNAREDVWTRAAPVLALVLMVEVLLAANHNWPVWANALVLAGAAAALAGAVAIVNRLRNRPALALPNDVGTVELAGFVAIGGVLQLIGGQTTSAWVVCAVNAGLLVLLYGWFAYGLSSIIRFTGRRVGEQLAAAVGLLARAIPLLLLFSVVLFLTTEMWQVFAGMNDATLAAIGVLLVAVGSTFLVVRVPKEVGHIERDVAPGPELQPRQRVNIGLVLFVTQALQVLLVAVAVGAFFVAFGALAVSADVTRSWTGSQGNEVLFLSLGDIHLRVTVELLRVSAAIAAFSGLYYSVAALTDSTYREEFLEELTGDLRTVLSDRVAYLELRSRTGV